MSNQKIDTSDFFRFVFPFNTAELPGNPDGYAIASATAAQRIVIMALVVSVNGADTVWKVEEEDGANHIGPVYYNNTVDVDFAMIGTKDVPVLKGAIGKDILFSSSDVAVAVTVSGWGYKEAITP